MAGYTEVFTDPSYAGQAVCMTYPLIGNYGVCVEDMESERIWVDAVIVRELSHIPSNFRCDMSIQEFLEKYEIPGIEGIDTRALVRLLRDKGTMNGYITTNESLSYEDVKEKLHAYTTGDVVSRVSCKEKTFPASQFQPDRVFICENIMPFSTARKRIADIVWTFFQLRQCPRSVAQPHLVAPSKIMDSLKKAGSIIILKCWHNSQTYR